MQEGVLDNGLHWVMLPNRMPPGRFEAHLQVHTGSIDESEHEQVGTRKTYIRGVLFALSPMVCFDIPGSQALEWLRQGRKRGSKI